MYKKKFITILVISFNLSQSFNYSLISFTKNGSNQRSILSVYGPRRSQMQGGKNWILPKEINANGSSETLIGWRSGKTTYVTPWD
jgi:hypothetical protein